MAVPNNVFRGVNSVVDFFDPDKNPPLPLVEIPDRLNPYRKDGVRIYAKMLTLLPAQNVKSLPALRMLREIPGAESKTIVEASSGSTALSLGIIARVLWGHENVDAYVTNKKHPESLNLLRFFGITPHLYGGLNQQEPTDETGVMCRLKRLAAKRDDMVYPGQYHNENNWKAHEQWTGPQILSQMPEINIFSTTVGTGGCITGTASYLKLKKPSCKNIGIFNVRGDPTPGPRNFEGFNSCKFPWKEMIDAFVAVGSVESFRMSMHLSREGLICGPSSGQALEGLLKYIGQVKKAGGLAQFADEKTGEVSCVFTLSDLPYQYLPQYFQKLGEEEFPTIQNQILLQCDQYSQEEQWAIDPARAVDMFQLQPKFPLQKNEVNESTICLSSDSQISQSSTAPSFWSLFRSSISGLVGCVSSGSDVKNSRCCLVHAESKAASAVIIDLRSNEAFRRRHLPGSVNLPLEGLTPQLGDGDLFGHPDIVHKLWHTLQKMLSDVPAQKVLRGIKRDKLPVLVICYNGDACRMGTSTLQNQGIQAFSVKEGFRGLMSVMDV